MAGDSPPADTTTGRFLLEVQNEDIRKVLELLARNTGLNILISKTVQGTVTVSLRDVDLETAIEALLQATGYAARKFPQYVFIGTAEECSGSTRFKGAWGSGSIVPGLCRPRSSSR